MIENAEAVATIPVRDMGTARDFYEKKLGLTSTENRSDDVITYQAGHGKLFVYRSELAGSNRATAVTWSVGGKVDDTVRELKAKGIGFEHYDMPGMHLEGDVHVEGPMRAAWFKDPDGNIHALVSS